MKLEAKRLGIPEEVETPKPRNQILIGIAFGVGFAVMLIILVFLLFYLTK